MRVVKAAAVQLSPILYSREGTVDKIVRKIADLGQQGVQFATFPETVVPYYPYFSFLQPAYQIVGGREHMKLLDQAVTVPSAATHAIGDACRQAQVVVSIGVNERDGDTMYNTQLLFDADGRLIQRRRKISPTYHERMVWGQGDAAGLKVVDTRVGRVGALACWEHYNPLARYALMAQHEEIHCAQFPGSLVGSIFADQMDATIRHHALESGCFVVNATGWLSEAQIAAVTPDAGLQKALRGGCHTAIVSPEGVHLAPPLREGEGMVVADLDMSLITKRKRMMDSVGHYARPELLSLAINERPAQTLFEMPTAPAAMSFNPEPSA